MLTRRLLTVLAAFVVLLGAPTVAVADPAVQCPPGQTGCSIHDKQPGLPGGSGGDPGGSSGGGDGKCYENGKEVACYDPVFGWFNSSDGCYYKLTEPQRPPKDDSGGAWYTPTCANGVVGEPDWFPTAPGGTPPDPETLAREALAEITLAVPDIQIRPDQGPGLVGLPVWLWVGRSANTWGPIENAESSGPLTVEISARVTRLTFELGDGKTIDCSTGGTPYPKGATGPSPDCGHVYQKAGDYTVNATAAWTVDWSSSSGASGTLEPQIRTASQDVRIDEMQVVTE